MRNTMKLNPKKKLLVELVLQNRFDDVANWSIYSGDRRLCDVSVHEPKGYCATVGIWGPQGKLYKSWILRDTKKKGE